MVVTDLAKRSGADEISLRSYATGKLRLDEAICSALAESWTSWCRGGAGDREEGDRGGDEEKIHIEGNVEI